MYVYGSYCMTSTHLCNYKWWLLTLSWLETMVIGWHTTAKYDLYFIIKNFSTEAPPITG